ACCREKSSSRAVFSNGYGLPLRAGSPSAGRSVPFIFTGENRDVTPIDEAENRQTGAARANIAFHRQSFGKEGEQDRSLCRTGRDDGATRGRIPRWCIVCGSISGCGMDHRSWIWDAGEEHPFGGNRTEDDGRRRVPGDDPGAERKSDRVKWMQACRSLALSGRVLRRGDDGALCSSHAKYRESLCGRVLRSGRLVSALHRSRGAILAPG